MAQDVRLSLTPAAKPATPAAKPPPGPLPVSTKDPAGVITWDPVSVTLPQAAQAKQTSIDPHGIIWDPPSTAGLPQLPETGPPHPFLDTVRSVAQEASPVLGAMLGATEIGPLVKGVPALLRIGATAGAAGVGAMGGRAVGDTLMRDPHGPPGSITDTATAMKTDAMMAAAGEAVPSAVGSGLKTIFTRKLASTAQRGATPASREVVDYLARIGGAPTPGNLAPDSSFIQILENIFEGAPASRGPWKANAKITEDAFARERDRILAQYGGRQTASEAGQVIKNTEIHEATRQAQQSVASATRRSAELSGPAREAQHAVTDARGRLTARYGPPQPLEDFSTMQQQLIDAAHKAAREGSSARYNTLWQETERQGIKGSIDEVYARAQQLMDQTGEPGLSQGVLGRATGAVKKLTTPIADAAEEATAAADAIPGIQYLRDAVAAGPNPRAQSLLAELEHVIPEGSGSGEITPRQLNQLRSLYGRLTTETTGNARGAFAKLAQAADESLTAMLGGEGSPLRQEYDLTKSLHKQMVETFEESALASAASAEPKDFLKWISGAGTGRVTDINRAKAILTANDPAAWSRVQAQHFASLSQAADGTPLTPGEFLAKLQKVPEEQLRAIYGGGASDILDFKGLVTHAAEATAAAKGSTTLVTNAAETGAARVAKAHALDPFGLVNKALNRASGDNIAKLRTLVESVEPGGWKKVQARKLEDWLSDPSGEVTKDLFAKLPPREQLIQIFPEDQANFLYQFARVRKELVRETAMGGTGKMWIQLATPAAAGSVAAGIVTGNLPAVASGTAIILTPRILAKIATSPEMRRALITGMKPTVVHTPSEVGRLGYQSTAHLASMALAKWLRSQNLINADGTPTEVSKTGPPPAGVGPGPRAGQAQPLLQGSTPGRQGGPGPRAGVAPPSGL